MAYLGVLLACLSQLVLLVQPISPSLYDKCHKGERWTEMDFATDCRKWFFACRNGEVIKDKCPPDAQFNPDSGRCEVGFKSKCLYPKAITDCVKGVIWTREDPANCATAFYHCYNGQVKRIVCPEGSQYSRFNQNCTVGYQSPCNRPVEARDCVRGVIWTKPNHHDCRTMFYRCVDGNFTKWVCDKGSQYSEREGKCIHGYLSDCEDNAPLKRKDCLEDQKWRKPDPLNCAMRYFDCNHGVFKAVSCERGYEFNSAKGECQLGYSSDCNESNLHNITSVTPAAD